jgi:B9 domain-containing protein 2
VNILGSLRGASFLPGSSHASFCRWRLVAGPAWSLLEGSSAGQTQAALVDRSLATGLLGSFPGEAFEPSAGSAAVLWEHPLDARLSCSALAGWPQLLVTVWSQDELQRSEIIGYGCARVPVAPGEHVLEIATWRPEGSWLQELRAAFLGGGVPQLTDISLVYDPSQLGGRHGLCTTTSAAVEVQLQVLVRGFAERGVTLNA